MAEASQRTLEKRTGGIYESISTRAPIGDDNIGFDRFSYIRSGPAANR